MCKGIDAPFNCLFEVMQRFSFRKIDDSLDVREHVFTSMLCFTGKSPNSLLIFALWARAAPTPRARTAVARTRCFMIALLRNETLSRVKAVPATIGSAGRVGKS
jgi:hypothetical protein